MKENLRNITLFATMAGLAAGCAEIDQSKKADQRGAQVYRLSAEEFGKNKLDVPELIEEKRGKTLEIIDPPDLFEAIKRNDLKTVQSLIEKGADVNIHLKAVRENTTYILATPLMKASIDGHIEIAQLLIEKGADINAINDHGETPLMCAAWSGHVNVVKLLLENGADPNMKTKDGETALSAARKKGHARVVELLDE